MIAKCTSPSIKCRVFRSSYSISSRCNEATRTSVATKGAKRRRGDEGKVATEKASHLNSAKFSRLYHRPDCELRSFAGSSLKLTFLPVSELNLLTVLAPPGDVRRRGTGRGATQSHVSSFHHHHVRAGVVVQNIGRHCRQKSASMKISYNGLAG